MKIYVFGIGGTGSRVLKALTMLMAAGVDINANKIVPVIIDPDEAAADLTRTVALMRKYNAVRNELEFTSASNNKFFKTEITETLSGFRLNLANTKDVKFRDFMDASSLSKANQALVSMLFSEDNLESNMQVGFKGNPNIGSVVLNQFADSAEFKNLASTFQQGDRIFIVSSIFGGTGASGFPLLLKNLRNIDSSIPSSQLIKDAPIGAITVLPYFAVKPDDDSKIDSSTFISKTKAALSYYERNVSGNNSLNALYYIADSINKQYENHEGGVNQKNDAHFIELASALSIIDFTKMSNQDLSTTNGKADIPIYKEFGVEKESSRIIFGDMSNGSQVALQKPLTQFILFSKYLTEQMNDSSTNSQTWKIDQKFDNHFISSQFYNSNLMNIVDDYIQWLREMGNNERAFEPFELEEKKNDLFSLVKGKKPAKLNTFASNYALFDARLNKLQLSLSNDARKEQKFVELFYIATEKLVNEKFKF